MKYLATTEWEHRMLYSWHNHRYDGEVYLAFMTSDGLRLVEQHDKFPAGVILGEFESDVVDGKFVYEILPVRERTAEEQEKLAQQVEAHRQYRAECWRRYSIADRIADLKKGF